MIKNFHERPINTDFFSFSLSSSTLYVTRNLSALFQTILFFICTFGFSAVLMAQAPTTCPCENCPDLIEDATDWKEYSLNIFNIQNNDLSTSSQCVSKVGVSFTHDYLGDVLMELISPGGDTVGLVGPITFSRGPSGQTDNRQFEVTFVPASTIAQPDDDYETRWHNDQDWVGIGLLEGSYYPNRGNLEDFDEGRVNGTWRLRVIDLNPENNDVGELVDFYVEFCDSEGLVCDPCLDPEDNPTCTFMVDPGESTVVPDEIFCLPVYAKNVAFLQTLRFPLNWNPSVLEYVGVDSFKIEFLEENDFNTTDVSNGNLTFEYIHTTDPLGLVVQDSTPIFSVCFKAVGAVGDSSLVSILSPPEAIDVDGVQMAQSVMEGLVRVAVDSTADCIRAIQLCDNSPISIDKSRGPGFIENEAIRACEPNGEEHQSKWFRFDVLASGSLEFMIRPKGAASYGFSLYQGDCPNENTSQPIGCESGFPLIAGRIIGASDNPLGSFGELDDGGTNFSPSVSALAGETYFLLVDNFSENAVGFDLTFAGNAVIGDKTIRSIIDDPAIINCTNPTIQLNALNATQGSRYDPVWMTDTGRIDITMDIFQPVITKGGLFTLAITDRVTGCVSKDSVLVLTDRTFPDAMANNGGFINCANPTLNLNSAGSSNGPQFDLAWQNLSIPNLELPGNSAITVEEGGDYELQITNRNNGCISKDTTTVVADFEPPHLSAPDSFIDCKRSTTFLTASSTTSEVTYEWSGGNLTSPFFNPQLSVNDTGAYVIKVTAPNGCTSMDSVFVRDERIFPIVEAGEPLTLNCDNPVQSLSGLGTSEGTEFSYNWSTLDGHFVPGTNTQSLFPVVDSAGMYQLEVSNANNGCVSLASVTVDTSFKLPTIIFEADSILNCFEPVLIIDATKSDSGAIFNFEWFASEGKPIGRNDTYQPTVDQPGEYIMTIKNTETGCANSKLLTIAADATAPVADAGLTQTLNCSNRVVVLDGNASTQGEEFIYKWTSENGHFIGETSTLITQVDSAGLYQLTVENTLNGCSSNSAVTILDDFVTPDLSIPLDTTLTCRIPSISLTASSLTENTNFSWRLPNGTTQAQPIISTEVPGIHKVTATALNGCTTIDSLFIDAQQLFPNIDFASSDTITCVQDIVTIVGENSEQGENFEWQWFTKEGSFLTLEETTQLNPKVNAGGFYFLEITNTLTGCVALDSINVLTSIDPPEIDILADPEVFSCANTIIPVTAISNVENAQFEWKLMTQTKSEAALLEATAPGIYNIIVVNPANNCSSLSSVEILADTIPPMVDAGSVQELNCTIGAIQLDAAGSSEGAEFSYLWTNQSSDKISDSLVATVTIPGLYNLIVVDQSNGCRAIDTVRVIESRDNPIADAGKDTVYCSGTEELDFLLGGSLTSVGSEFSYIWKDLNQNILGDSSKQRVSSADTFILEVLNNDNNCAANDTVLVFEKPRPIINLAITGAINCIENEILYSAESDIITSTIEWFGNIEVDGSVLKVTDALLGQEFVAIAEDTLTGCKGTSDIISVREDRLPPVVSAGDDAILNCTDTLRLAGQLLNPEISSTLSWRTEDGNIVTDVNDFNPIVDAAGSYILTVENLGNFCKAEDTTLVVSDQILPTVILEQEQILTCNSSELSITPNEISEGPNFYYTWTDEDNKILSSDKELLVDFPGIYQLLVVDSTNLCSKSSFINILDSLNPPKIEIEIPETITCLKNQVVLNTITNIEEGTFVWSILSDGGNILGSRNSPDLLVDQAGTYQIEVTNDFTGCMGAKNISVSDIRDTIAVDAGVDKTITCNNDTTVLVAGTIFSDLANLTYGWKSTVPDFEPVDSLIFTVGEPGTYFLEVIDTLSGCFTIDSFFIDKDINPITFNIGETLMLDCMAENVIVGDVNDIGVANYLYEWSTDDGRIISGADQAAARVDQGGIYYLSIENTVNGCTFLDSQRVEENKLIPTIDIGLPKEITCVNETTLLGGEGTVMGASFLYEWTTDDGSILEGANTPFATINKAGIYQLLVTDTVNQCDNIAEISITEDKDFPQFSLPENLSFVCTDEFIAINPMTDLDPNDMGVSWTSTDGNIISEPDQFIANVSAPGWYQLELEDTRNSCRVTDSVLILDNRVLPVVATLEDRMLGCTNTSITLSAQGSDIGSNIVYEWKNEVGETLSNNTTLTLDEPGQYVLQVTNRENSCTNTDSVLISENFDPPVGADFIIESPSCDGIDNGYIEIANVFGGTAPFDYTLDAVENGKVSIFSDLAPQSYQLTIIDELSCVWDTVITLAQPAIIEVEILPGQDQLLTGEIGTFDFTTSLPEEEIAEIVWTPEDLFTCFDCSTVNTSFVRNTTIGVIITDNNGCEGTASLDISVDLAPIPNAITPNGDGANDFFIVPAIESEPDAYPESEFIVFNRWGDILYRVSPYNNDWSGTNKNGEPLGEGTYYYVLRLDTREGEVEKGDLTILRR